MLKTSLLLLAVAAAVLAQQNGFVLVKGGMARPGSPSTRVDDFEMAVHPVTNAEYKTFVDSTGHAAPLHWVKGAIPAGMENHPVIFVNRYDVTDYLRWRTRKEGRIYRLPSVPEFEYAARGGNDKAKYPWGDAPPAGKANYDAAGNRTFAEWRKFLKPVRHSGPNPYGLYDMAGNVWQMVDTYPDHAITRFKYRVAAEEEVENSLAGGSWARSEYYLRCGVRGGASSGIRHPDIGFRLVREPAGQTGFHRQPRRVIASSAGGGARLHRLATAAQGSPRCRLPRLSRDAPRCRRRAHHPRARARFHQLVDRSPGEGRVYYRVRAVGPGRQGGRAFRMGRRRASRRAQQRDRRLRAHR